MDFADRQESAGNGPYRDVRALERGLVLMQALADLGWSTPAMLAEQTGIDRSTIYRLLSTLQRCGFVYAGAEGQGYMLSRRIVEMASGVRNDDEVTGIVRPLLEALVRKVIWPSDFAVLTAGRLQIMSSSHHLTSMTVFRRMVGRSMPILTTALGRAILAAMTPEERETTLMAIQANGGDDARGCEDRAHVARLVSDVQATGYAQAANTVDPKISAIAVPIMRGARVAGAINLVFFTSALKPQQAASKFLDALRETAQAAEARLS